MAITFPLSLSTFWDALTFLAGGSELELLHQRKQSRDGAGNTLSASFGAPKWKGSYQVAPVHYESIGSVESVFKVLQGRDGTFLAYDKRKPYPAGDLTGAYLDNGSSVSIGGEAAYSDVSLGTYRYEGSVVTLTQAASVVSDAGTYWDADGVMQTQSANVLRVDYGPFANYIRNFKATGSTVGVIGSGGVAPTNWTITAGSGIAAEIIGTGTESGIAYVDIKFSGTASGGLTAAIDFESNTQVAAIQNQQWIPSTWLKVVAGSLATISSLRFGLREALAAGTFVADTLGSDIDTSITSALTRYSAALTVAGATTARIKPKIYIGIGNGAVVDFTLRVGVPLLNRGTTAITYPRVPLGIRVEPAFTQGLLRSEELDNASWTKTRATISANAYVAPDGTTTMDKAVDSVDVTNTHQVQQSYAGFVSGQVYTASCFVRAAELSRLQLALNGAAFSTVQRGAYNLADGSTSVAQGTPTLAAQDCGHGIWRVSLTATADATGSATAILYLADASGTIAYTGNASDGLGAWGLQVNGGALRSYVKTTTATVARAADALTIKGKGTNDWIVTFDNDATQAFNDDAGDFTPAASALTRQHIKKWTATRDTQPSAASVQIKSKGSDNRSLALKGLPPFYIITKGDKLSVAYSSTKVFLCEAMETIVADYLGETAEFEIQPFMPAGLAVNDAVTLKKPAGKFKLVAGSYQPASGQGNISSGIGFSMVSVP